jgi:hypothetical protein
MRGRGARRTLVVALALLASVLGPAVPRADALVDFVAGTCVFSTMNVTFSSPPLGLLPAGSRIDFSGSATCITSKGVASGATLAGWAVADVPPGINCLAGPARGTANFYIPGQFSSPMPANVTLANVSEQWTMALVNGVNMLGTGAFAMTAGSPSNCVSGGLASATWTGVVGFEDPTLSL